MNRSVTVGTAESCAVLKLAVVLDGVAVAASAVVLLVDLVGDVGGGAAVLVEDVVVYGVVRAAEECAVYPVLWRCAALQCALSI